MNQGKESYTDSVLAIENKNIVLTGGTSGIGLELVRQLHATNTVSIIARPSNALEDFRREFPGTTVFQADLSEPDAVVRAADEVTRANEKIDVLINNAAVQYTPKFLDDDFRLETIRREIDTNLVAPCVLIYLCLPSLLQSDKAIILNVNSALAFAPKTRSAVYCATKSGLDTFSQSLRYQLENTNVEVMQAFPPLVDTGMTRGRGRGKISAAEAAAHMIAGLQSGKQNIDIGKTRILRVLNRIAPGIARKIMKNG